MPDAQVPRMTVAVVGAGGNIGSHLVPHIGRMPEVGRVIVVDRDDYEEENLFTQDIARADVGRPKAEVQARRLRGIREDLEVVVITDAVENVPWGRLRSDAILCGLDSRASRCRLNQVAWRLGVPWVDAGVLADQMLARVTVYAPSRDAACLECGWSQADYDAVEQEYPCLGGTPQAASTNAPAPLGALAAAMQAVETRKILTGEWETSLAGRELVIDARHHGFFVSALPRDPECRFDHEQWRTTPLPYAQASRPIGCALEPGKDGAGGSRLGVLRFEGHPIVTGLRCPACGFSRQPFHLLRRLPVAERVCPDCGAVMEAGGSDLREEVALDQAPTTTSLLDLGLEPGDIFTFTSGGRVKHIEIGGIREDRPFQPSATPLRSICCGATPR